MERSQESSSLNLSEGESKHYVVSSRDTAYLWDKILQVSKIRELGKKEVRTPDVVLFSELRESRVAYGSEDSGDLSVSQRRIPRETEKHKQKIFHLQAILNPDEKATMEKEWKEVA